VTSMIRVFEDPAALATAVADALLALARGSERLTVALSGGSTPERLYRTLASPPYLEQMPWPRLALFFGDERAVPPDHAESNFAMARRALLDRVPVEAHRMEAERGAAADYERLLRERVPAGEGGLPSFDVVLLGLGTDGHTASLFPGTSALDERERLVVMNDVPQLGTSRMTLTYPLLAAAQRAWFLIAGADKRAVLADVLAAGPGGDRRWPASSVRPTLERVFWLDRAAAPPADG
jgi:6-phosphogluconolactonase